MNHKVALEINNLKLLTTIKIYQLHPREIKQIHQNSNNQCTINLVNLEILTQLTKIS